MFSAYDEVEYVAEPIRARRDAYYSLYGEHRQLIQIRKIRRKKLCLNTAHRNNFSGDPKQNENRYVIRQIPLEVFSVAPFSVWFIITTR